MTEEESSCLRGASSFQSLAWEGLHPKLVPRSGHQENQISSRGNCVVHEGLERDAGHECCESLWLGIWMKGRSTEGPR